MSAIAPDIEGAKVLDLFAGSGALGLECLSRGASHATFVEQAPRALGTLRANLEELGASGSSFKVVRADAIRFVEGLRRYDFDVALADPPYRQGLGAALAERFSDRPFARLLCIEHAPNEEIPGEPAWQRRYGDTVLTFLRNDDD